jgi:hypothetical protein
MKARTRRSRKTSEVTFSNAELLEMDREVERYIERWLRHVILVEDDGTPRRLSEEEVRDDVKSTRAFNRRRRANYRRRLARRVRRGTRSTKK